MSYTDMDARWDMECEAAAEIAAEINPMFLSNPVEAASPIVQAEYMEDTETGVPLSPEWVTAKLLEDDRDPPSY